MRRAHLAKAMALLMLAAACSDSGPGSGGPERTTSTVAASSTSTPGAPAQELVWHPGHYLIVNTAESGQGGGSAAKVAELLAEPDAQRFSGVQVKLLWRDLEATMGRYDFGALDAVLDAAEAAPSCTAGDGTRDRCRVLLQVQYKTSSPLVPAVPDYLLSTGAYCDQAGSCGIPADPSARSALQRTFCATTGAQRCGAHEAVPRDESGGESLAMLWLPGVEARFAAMLEALQDHVLARAGGDTLTAYSLPETTFEADPAEEGKVLLVDEGYTREAYTAALRRTWLAAWRNDPTRVVFQFVGNMPLVSRRDLQGWTELVRGFWSFAADNPGLGVGHPDVAPLLGPTEGTPPHTVNPALAAMTDPELYRVPRNPSVQAPDVTPRRTTGFAESYAMVVDAARGNYIAWTTSTRDAIFTWHDVARHIAGHPLPEANLAPPSTRGAG